MLAVVRKIQIPWNPESGFGAVSWDGHVVINETILSLLGLSKDEVTKAIAHAVKSVDERRERFVGDRKLPSLTGKYIILTDDGLASGYTMIAAIDSVKRSNPSSIMVAVPTGSRSAVNLVSKRVDDLVCLNIRSGLSFAVADAFVHWHDLSDIEVNSYLRQASEMGIY
jgi:predicted phosphoribosyltransferase